MGPLFLDSLKVKLRDHLIEKIANVTHIFQIIIKYQKRYYYPKEHNLSILYNCFFVKNQVSYHISFVI